MIVWRGKGILTLFAPGLAALTTFGLLGKLLKIQPYANEFHRGKDTMIIGATIMLLAALYNYLSTIAPGLKDRPNEVVTRQDGSRAVINHAGSFMFIPRKIWTIIFALIGLGLLVASFLQK